jgi:hypothetical protein
MERSTWLGQSPSDYLMLPRTRLDTHDVIVTGLTRGTWRLWTADAAGHVGYADFDETSASLPVGDLSVVVNGHGRLRANVAYEGRTAGASGIVRCLLHGTGCPSEIEKIEASCDARRRAEVAVSNDDSVLVDDLAPGTYDLAYVDADRFMLGKATVLDNATITVQLLPAPAGKLNFRGLPSDTPVILHIVGVDSAFQRFDEVHTSSSASDYTAENLPEGPISWDLLQASRHGPVLATGTSIVKSGMTIDVAVELR